MPALPTAIDAALGELDAAERGFVLGLLVAGEADAADGAEALTGPARERCADAARAIAALPRPERVQLMGLLAREVLAPVPAGIENVHPDILRGLLEGESADTIMLVCAGGPPALRAAGAAALAARATPGNQQGSTPSVEADVVADLQRAVFASIVAVPPHPPDVEPTRWAHRLLTLAPAALLTAVMNAGAELLGASLRGADEETVKRAAAHLETPWSERIVIAARSTTDSSGDALEIDRARARALVAAVTPAAGPRQTLRKLGARAIGDRLGREDPGLALAVAQRLPSELGPELLAACQP